MVRLMVATIVGIAMFLLVAGPGVWAAQRLGTRGRVVALGTTLALTLAAIVQFGVGRQTTISSKPCHANQICSSLTFPGWFDVHRRLASLAVAVGVLVCTGLWLAADTRMRRRQPAGSQGWRHKALLAPLSFVLAVALAGGGLWGLSRWHDRSYIGTTRRITLDWDCWNAIFWTDTSRGVRWWAGDPVPDVPVETATTGGPGFLTHYHATGTLHFASYRTAVFTSDSGATLTMTREPRVALHNASCSGR